MNTNDFTEKGNLTSRNLFKSQDPVLLPSNRESINQKIQLKSDLNQSYDAETGKLTDSCGTVLEQRESEIPLSNQRGSCSHDNNSSGAGGQGAIRRHTINRDSEGLFQDTEVANEK